MGKQFYFIINQMVMQVLVNYARSSKEAEDVSREVIFYIFLNGFLDILFEYIIFFPLVGC